jgi:DNA-binding response OmpR family regulator
MIAEPDVSDKPRLLIIDDDPMLCRLMKIQLELEGYVCETLSDPRRALEAIAETSPELIVVDFNLGTQGGLDLFQTIRSHEAYKRLPVIVMSGMDYQRESEQAGVDDFVLKPFKVEDFLTTIQDVLDRRSENSRR